MKNFFLLAVVAAGMTVPLAHAQSTSTSNQTSNAASTASNSNTGTNASTNAATSNANQTSTSGAQNQNQQSNGSSSTAGGGSGVGTGGNVTANIAPTTNIQFVSPPAQRVEQATTSTMDSTSRIEQAVSGTTEQILSGTRTERIEYSGTTTVRNVPSMNAPPLTSSNDTCMGSWSAGVAVAGFGASGGNTYTDEHCKRIKMSRELWNKGMKAASLAMDCMDRDAREALELTGFVCPQTTRAQQRAGVIAPMPSVAAFAPAVVTPVVAAVPPVEVRVAPPAPTAREQLRPAMAAQPVDEATASRPEATAAAQLVDESTTVRAQAVMGAPPADESTMATPLPAAAPQPVDDSTTVRVVNEPSDRTAPSPLR